MQQLNLEYSFCFYKALFLLNFFKMLAFIYDTMNFSTHVKAFSDFHQFEDIHQHRLSFLKVSALLAEKIARDRDLNLGLKRQIEKTVVTLIE